MPVVRVKAIEVVDAIRQGMDDATLMERFGISARGLQKLFRQLVTGGIVGMEELEQRMALSHASVIIDVSKEKFPVPEAKKLVVDALEALNCIRSGMDEKALMRKYTLSAKGVQSLIRKLEATGALAAAELKRIRSISGYSVIVEDDTGEHGERPFEPIDVNLVELRGLIESGWSRAALMERFNVSARDLVILLNQLVAEGLITESELRSKLPETVQEFRIRHKVSNKIIFGGQASSFGALVEKAVSAGVELVEANLSGQNLARTTLTGARLSKADLRQANLMGADLTGARLDAASLVCANLARAILYKTNLCGADLSEANLSTADGVWAFLNGANLFEADLTDANFTGANLIGANLLEANLTRTNLYGAYLEGANIQFARRDAPRS
jgi:uncharacterized protein YjbI with pentapeptide repeats